MRVVQVTHPNGPLELVEREVPGPGTGAVRVKVQACGICHSDAVTQEGIFPGIQYPRVPGHEIAGVITHDRDPAAELVKLGGARVILATVTEGRAMSAVLGGLGVNGKLIILGVPPQPLEIPALPLILGRRSVAGWPSGTSIDSQDTLAFSLLAGVRPMTEVFPLERAAEAYEHMLSGKARFRAVLTTGG
jgi:D-arabinose 1-dehydrogenase-like Zn-dependent alcohol dehydrogenase